MKISSLAICTLAAEIIGLPACGGDSDAPNPDGPPMDTPAVDLTCSNYCTKITANWTGGNAQYGSMVECMSSCAHFAVGAATDAAANTLGCRLYHAGAAMTGPAAHCRHAGPGGDGVCGAACEGFCAIVLASCTGGNGQYGGDLGTCMTAWGGFAATPLYDASVRSGDRCQPNSHSLRTKLIDQSW